MAMTIGPVGPSREWEVLDVITAAFASVASDFQLTRENAPTNAAFWTIADVRRALDRGEILMGLEEDGLLRGCVFLRPGGTGGAWELKHLAVIPEFRHRGFGEALVRAAIGVARDGGGRVLTIGIIAENGRLDQWYQRLGFRPNGSQRYAHLPFTVNYLALSL